MFTFSRPLIVACAALYLVTVGLLVSTFVWTPHGSNDYPVLRGFIIFFAGALLLKYFLYMFFSPWYDVVMRFARRSKKRYQPRVSVIIPAWNEEVGILNTVRSVLKSTYGNLEVIVVNDGSTDHSDEIMRTYAKHYTRTAAGRGKTLHYHYKENGGKGSALNYGIALSSGDIVITIDGDCAIEPTTVENFVRHFENEKVMAAVGNVKIANATGILGVLQYLEFLFSFYFKKADSLFNTVYIIGGAAGAFRREVFDRIGGFNTKNITEDIDLSVRIQKAGMRIVYAADAVVYTEGADTLVGLMKQRLRWKRGRFQTFYEHRHLFFSERKGHNKLLTWGVLPLALFGEVQLFFEPFFLGFLYLYSFLISDFSSFISGIIVVSAMFLVQIADDRSLKRLPLLALAPIGWLLFYVTTWVEHRALINSIRGMLFNQEIRWQRWQRRGIMPGKPGLAGRSNPL